MAYERVNWENLPSTKTPVNADNLNKMENGIDQAGAEIFVGAEEPTTGEKVWFRKGKNYLDISKLKARTTYGITFTPTDTGIKISGTADDTYAYGGTINLKLEKGKTYTLYGNNAGNTFRAELKKNGTVFMALKTEKNITTFTPTENVESITFVLEGISKGTTYNYEISNLQIEQGSKATPYENYIEQKIYVRNSNGVYEEYSKQIKKELLWENSTNSALPATDITLSSDDYDELEIQYRTSVLYEVGDKSEKIKKGSNFKLSDIINNNGGAMAVSRLIKRNSDTSYTAEIAHYTNLNSSFYAGTESRFCIPLRIYGIKRS